jgi:putative sigma-54 modulation protein
MKLQITTRHFDITPEFRSYAEERIRKLKRYFDQIIDVNVILTTEKHRHAAEISLHMNGTNLVGTSESEDMRSSVDGAVSRIEAQLKKHKDRLTERKKGVKLGPALAAEADNASPPGVEIEDDTEE